jgi:FkbM family methyltransferase
VRAADEALRRVGPPLGSVAATIHGLRFVLDPSDHIQHALFYHGAYAPDVGGWLAAEIRARAARVLWDVGANIGALSLPLMARFPDLAVEAFEPDPDIANQYATHVTANIASHSQRVRLQVLALADVDGEAAFYPSAVAANLGLGSLVRSATTCQLPIDVACARGDTLVAKGLARSPDVIKIDVEGFEHEVVRGLGALLATARPSLIIEHSPARLLRRGLPIDALWRDLIARGYACRRLVGRVESALVASDLRQRLELIARPLGA